MAETSYIENADGQKLFVRSWEPSGSDPKAVVFLVHGAGEHTGRYEEQVGQYLQGNQYAVFGHDHIGHGKSEGDRVFIENFQTYVRDVFQHVELLKARFPSLPFFLYGHSMGGTVTALAIIQRPELFNGVVFSSPSLLPGAGPLMRGVARVVAFFAPQSQIHFIDPNDISSIPSEVEAYVQDPLVWHGGLKARWVVASFEAAANIANGVATIELPYIVLHGSADKIVDIASSQFLMDNAQSSDKTFERFQGGFHELVNDTERDRFKEAVLDWLNSHAM